MKVVIQTKWGKVWGELLPEGAEAEATKVLISVSGFKRVIALINARTAETGPQSLLLINQDDILTIGIPDQEQLEKDAKARENRRPRTQSYAG